MTTPLVRTRFAPSPSGHLHVGGARTALFCWAYARQKGGKFILRIEDTDQKRSSDSASLAFFEDLQWLGIHWDEGPKHEHCGGGEAEPYFQSQRLAIYDRYINQLIADGKAYRAFETKEELDARNAAARAEKRNPRYDRAALKLTPETVQQYLSEGRPHVVRFRIPDNRGPVVLTDAVRGEVTTELVELDDFVIRKADGFPMYNFAVVVDDELMGVTHVIRAQEHLSNTPKHILLQEALGFRLPAYAHISIITNPDGSKMSKRDKDKALRAEVKRRGLERSPSDVAGALIVDDTTWSAWLGDKNIQLDADLAEPLAASLGIMLPEINVDDFRRNGYLPEVLINYLALLGWSSGNDIETFTRDFLVQNFSLNRIIKSPAKFDREKLLAFNLRALQALTADQFADLFVAHCHRYHPEFTQRLNASQLHALGRVNHERSKTLEDQVANSRFFIVDDEQLVYDDSKTVRDALEKGEPNGYSHLEALSPLLTTMDSWHAEHIEAVVKAYAQQSAEGKLGKVAQPLRIAVSGGVVSPAIFDTLEILGKERVLARIQRCIARQALIQSRQ